MELADSPTGNLKHSELSRSQGKEMRRRKTGGRVRKKPRHGSTETTDRENTKRQTEETDTDKQDTDRQRRHKQKRQRRHKQTAWEVNIENGSTRYNEEREITHWKLWQ